MTAIGLGPDFQEHHWWKYDINMLVSFLHACRTAKRQGQDFSIFMYTKKFLVSSLGLRPNVLGRAQKVFGLREVLFQH